MKDDLYDFLSLADDVANTPQDDPGFEEKSRRFAVAFMDSFIPKEYATIINPDTLKAATAAVREIRNTVDRVLLDSFGPDLKAEYSVHFGGFSEEHLDLVITIRDAWLTIRSIDFWNIVKVLPDDFTYVVSPAKNGFEITFEFRNVKDFISRGHTPSDDWFGK